MSTKKTSIVYRIKDKETGLYYTGGTHGYIKNEEFDPTYFGSTNYMEAENWTYDQKKKRDFWYGKYPWNLYYKEKWNSVGKIFTNKRGAEKALSTLTGTSKYTRETPTKNILFGNQKSINYEIVESVIDDLKKDKNEKG